MQDVYKLYGSVVGEARIKLCLGKGTVQVLRDRVITSVAAGILSCAGLVCFFRDDVE